MKNSGFTLIELLITLTILSVLLTLAVPAYNNFLTSNRLTTQANQLISAINFARSEAITRHATVTVCASDNQKICSGEWDKGWIVFVDKQASGQVNPEDKILRVYAALPKGEHLEWNSLRGGYLQMSASGGTRGQNGFFMFSSTNNDLKQKIVVSKTGRVRVEK